MVSCIIPAYNEASRIGIVLDVVMAAKIIDEVIVVDDGSSDDTSAAVKKYKNVKLIRLGSNRGKCGAVYVALQDAIGEVILLLDADIQGLTIKNIADLVSPVIEEKRVMTIAAIQDPMSLSTVFGFDPLTGERALTREVLRKMGDFSKERYALEVLCNQFAKKNNISIRPISMFNVRSYAQTHKIGFWRGSYNAIMQFIQLTQTIGIVAFISQFIWLFEIGVKFKRAHASR